MRALLALVAFLQISVAFARPVGQPLLDCNLSHGPDQQVIVTRNGGELALNELTNTGRWESRVLSNEEYESGVLQLRKGDWDHSATLTNEGGAWFYELIGEGVTIREYADCR